MASKTLKSDNQKYLFRYEPLHKSLTGIKGFDEITNGGLPKGRTSLFAGAAGSGKTVFGVEFLVMGIVKYGEPGVLMSFEENEKELIKNFSAIGYDINKMISDNKLYIDYVYIERKEIEETGEFDLEGIFIRLENAIKKVGAKRVVLDTIEALFSGISNEGILRAEIRRLFRWLNDKGVTVIATAEQGVNTITRYGLEEYLADCVILLDQEVSNKIATRRLRVLKYRGSEHGTNEYPFLIRKEGISVLPITSINLEHEASNKKVSTGNKKLDTMLSGGYYLGSSTLISGTSGSGKTTFANIFANSIASGSGKALYISYEESPKQIFRNMASVGIKMGGLIEGGKLKIAAFRPSLYGLETHLVEIIDLVESFKPVAVVIDPISNFIFAGALIEAKSMVTRLIDYLKVKQITSIFTNLSSRDMFEETEVGISSLMDNWLFLKDAVHNGERKHFLHILKARGSEHSKQVIKYMFSRKGILLDYEHKGPESITNDTS